MSSRQNQENVAEETPPIEAAKRLIVFEEYANKRKMSVTSHFIHICETDPSTGWGLKDTIVWLKHREEGSVYTRLMNYIGFLLKMSRRMLN
jgi:hypothetical protein